MSFYSGSIITVTGLSRPGFRITNSDGDEALVEKDEVVEVDTSNPYARRKLSGERGEFIRVRARKSCAISNATPAVVLATGHRLRTGDIVTFSGGNLPSPIDTVTKYYVKYVNADTFQIALTYNGTSINTSTSGSGGHTLQHRSATIGGLGRGGFRIKDVTGAEVVVRYAGVHQLAHTVDLTDENVCRVLRRAKGEWYVAGTNPIFGNLDAFPLLVGLNPPDRSFDLLDNEQISLNAHSTQASNNTTVTLGDITYTFKTNLTGYSVGVLLSDNTRPDDADTVTVGSITYRFKDTPAQAYDVKRHASSADTCLVNLAKAINQSGGSSNYFVTGTLVNPDVSAIEAISSHHLSLAARASGAGGDSLTLSVVSTHLTVSTPFGGGGSTVPNEIKIGNSVDGSFNSLAKAINGDGNAGDNYSTDTEASPDFTAFEPASGGLYLTGTREGAENVAFTTNKTQWSITINVGGIIRMSVDTDNDVSQFIDVTSPFNQKQLRVHYKAWIEEAWAF